MKVGNKIVLLMLLSLNGYLVAQEDSTGREMMKKYSRINIQEPMMGIEKEGRDESAEILNKVLSNEFVLLTQTLNYHWNLVGPQFHDYHKLFDEQYRKLFGFLDEIAERIRVVGGIAIASMSEIIQNANLKEDMGDIPEPMEMVKNILQQHEELIKILRVGINKTAANNVDMGTSNFLTDLMEKHEKMAWMLRSLTAR